MKKFRLPKKYRRLNLPIIIKFNSSNALITVHDKTVGQSRQNTLEEMGYAIQFVSVLTGFGKVAFIHWKLGIKMNIKSK